MDAPYYIHAIDPVLVSLWGPLAVRWYGLAYVAGFLATFMALLRWARAGSLRVAEEDVQTLLLFCVFGVMLGGRIGYLLFYNFDAWRTNPALLFRVWEGGMASHGGLLGLALAVWWFARSRRLPFLHVTDNLVCIGPLGIFFGRLANFVNGELWGRITDVRWAVLFPQEAGWFPPQPGFREEAMRLYEAGLISPRHPSPLYAAAIEGLLVWGLMLGVSNTAWGKKTGRLSALFLMSYAAGRFWVERYREPEIVYAGWLTQGQLLSLLMLIPAALILRSSSGRRT